MDQMSSNVFIAPPIMIVTNDDASPDETENMSQISSSSLRLNSSTLTLQPQQSKPSLPPTLSLLGGDLQPFNNMPPPKLNVVKKSRIMVNPGKSMVEWMRFQNDKSSRPQTRLRKIGLDELQSHNTTGDVWMALNDKVFDVTDYAKYHPGGVEEIMKGAGLDATNLFNQIHRWVNFESILKGNLLGYLVRQSTLPLLNKLKVQAATESHQLVPTTTFSENDTHVFFEIDSDLEESDIVEECWTVGILDRERLLLKVIIKPPDLWMIHLKLVQALQDDHIDLAFKNGFKRLIVTLKKPKKEIWKALGAPLAENNKLQDSRGAVEDMYPAKLIRRKEVAKNVYLFTVEMCQSAVVGVPVGFHLRIRLNGVSRKYTPVSSSLGDKPDPEDLDSKSSGQKLYFIIKLYPDGELTRQLDQVPMNDKLVSLEVGCSGGSFNFGFLHGVETLCIMAAGSGITPFIRLIQYLLSRRKSVPIKKVILIFFNETAEDIIWNDEWKNLAEREPQWFYFYPVISKGDENWNGLRGRISPELFENCIRDSCELFSDPNKKNQLGHSTSDKAMICGSYGFNDACKQTIRQQKVLRIKDSGGVFVFTG